MAMAARMMSCCSTALLSRAVVIRPHCIHRHVGVGVSLYGAELRKEKARIQHHRTICCSSASSPTNATEVQIQLYNTMKRQKEFFRPLVPGKVSMYVCGVTSYDYSHIGHARVYVAFDVLFRYLKSVGFDVTYVRNFTDIDDKTTKKVTTTGRFERFGRMELGSPKAWSKLGPNEHNMSVKEATLNLNTVPV